MLWKKAGRSRLKRRRKFMVWSHLWQNKQARNRIQQDWSSRTGMGRGMGVTETKIVHRLVAKQTLPRLSRSKRGKHKMLWETKIAGERNAEENKLYWMIRCLRSSSFIILFTRTYTCDMQTIFFVLLLFAALTAGTLAVFNFGMHTMFLSNIRLWGQIFTKIF